MASVTARVAREGLRIRIRLRVRHVEDVVVDGDGGAGAAVAVALPGYLHVVRLPGHVPAATGVRGPRALGALTPA